jgi:hypothetical protein
MGTSNTCVNGTFKPCSFCGGTGEVKDNLCETCGTICPFDDEHLECDNYTPLTNEGRLRTATTEQLAKEIYKIAKDDFKELRKLFYGVANDDCDAIALWLKQPHVRGEKDDNKRII